MKLATQAVLTASGAKAEEIKAIGISYQMHGLVCVDKNQQVLRPSSYNGVTPELYLTVRKHFRHWEKRNACHTC